MRSWKRRRRLDEIQWRGNFFQMEGMRWGPRWSYIMFLCHYRGEHVFYLQIETSFKRIRGIYCPHPMVWSPKRTFIGQRSQDLFCSASVCPGYARYTYLDVYFLKKLSVFGNEWWEHLLFSSWTIRIVFLIGSEISLTFARGRVYQVLRADEGQSVWYGRWHLFSRARPALQGQPLTYLTSPHHLVGCLPHRLLARFWGWFWWPRRKPLASDRPHTSVHSGLCHWANLQKGKCLIFKWWTSTDQRVCVRVRTCVCTHVCICMCIWWGQEEGR